MNRAALASWWEGLAERERRLVTIGGLTVLLVVGYLLLWEPPAEGIRKLQADLPRLRSQDAAMRAMADEAASLRTASGSVAAIPPVERVAAVRRTLQRAGLWREGGAADGASRPESSGNPVSTVSTLSVGGTSVTTVASGASTRIDPPVVTTEPNDRIRVRFDNIDYGVWVSWLASTEGELSARATRVSVVALAPKAPVGHVRAEVVLDWTQPASPPRS